MIDMIGTPAPAYLEEMMDRIVATELEQLSRIGALDAKPFFNYQQPTFPYITHRLGEDLLVEQGDSTQERTYTVFGRFVGAHQSGVDGVGERLVYQFEPSLVSLFTQNMYLVSEGAFSEPMLEMSAMPITFKRASGTRFWDNRGTGLELPGQMGFEFSITAVFNLDIRRRY